VNQKKKFRISKDEYFIKIAGLVSKRSTCIKRNVGSVLVNLKSGENPELCRGVHSEINCIIQAAIHGTSIKGNTTLYTTYFPCMSCLKLIIHSGIKRLVYKEGYNMENKVKQDLLNESKLEVQQLLE